MRAQQGFTLLELLVSMMLLALIMSLLLGGLQLASRASEAGAERAEALGHVGLAQAWLRSEIARARPLVLRPEQGEPRLAFRGEPQRLQFVSQLSPHHGGALYAIALLVDRRHEKPRLSLRYQPLYPDALELPDWEGGEELILLDGIAAAELGYYGRAGATEPAEWHASWERMDTLPDLVRLVVEWPDGRAAWPEFIAAPLLGKGAVRAEEPL
jgi:general secretion pathway protein J